MRWLKAFAIGLSAAAAVIAVAPSAANASTGSGRPITYGDTSVATGTTAGPTVHMVSTTAVLRSGVVRPSATGPVVSGDCGTAQLIVNGGNARYAIKLYSTNGIITGGFYSINTDGIANVIQTGFISSQNSVASNTVGTILVPGIWIHAAIASGVVITSRTTCTFYIAAPW
jgi:hypothetical protein